MENIVAILASSMNKPAGALAMKQMKVLNMTDLKRVSKMGAIIFMSTALTGCLTSYQPADYTYTGTTHAERHPITVNTEIKSVRFDITPNVGALTHAQEQALTQFIREYNRTPHRKLKLEAPATNVNREAVAGVLGDLAAHFRSAGIAPKDVIYKKYSDPSAGNQTPIILSYHEQVARVPTCGDWSVNLAKTYGNKAMPNLGCAQQSNLAAMVADPRDLKGPRKLTPSDFERRSVVIDKYRKGEVTSSARSDEESGKVSEVGE